MMFGILAISVPPLLDPVSFWDHVRVVNVILGGVLLGMAIEILRRYWSLYHRPPYSARAGHVVAVASSFILYVILTSYANLFQIDRDSAIEEVAVPLGFLAGIVGIVGLYAMLRTLSGKSDRPDS